MTGVEADIKAYYLNVSARQSSNNKRFFPSMALFANIVELTDEE